MGSPKDVLVTGATGYMGSRLVRILLARGHHVTAVVREGSQFKLPSGCSAVVADVFDRASWEGCLTRAHVLVHLVGVAHPSTGKTLEFIDVDLRAAREAIAAAKDAGVAKMVYVSVAHPAPVMKQYQMVRAACEAAIREAGLNATILRPWYVLGPGHWWPVALLPAYKLAEVLPWARATAMRLGLVSIRQMIAALVSAVEDAQGGVQILEVPEIREAAI